MQVGDERAAGNRFPAAFVVTSPIPDLTRQDQTRQDPTRPGP
jgi:hypothetical protein